MAAREEQQQGQDKLKLLVPISFTQKSELALDFALGYSQRIHADVYLFHVFEDSTSDYRRLDRLNEEYMERMKQVVMMAIERQAAKGISHAVEGVHRRISQGKPWIEILKMAGGISADMIIMGKPNSNQFKKLFAKVPCTLVLVREKDPEFVMS
jgi:nucleotide-binding universal stress UspA family protein